MHTDVIRLRGANMGTRRLIEATNKGCQVRDWIVGERDMFFLTNLVHDMRMLINVSNCQYHGFKNLARNQRNVTMASNWEINCGIYPDENMTCSQYVIMHGLYLRDISLSSFMSDLYVWHLATPGLFSERVVCAMCRCLLKRY